MRSRPEAANEFFDRASFDRDALIDLYRFLTASFELRTMEIDNYLLDDESDLLTYDLRLVKHIRFFCSSPKAGDGNLTVAFGYGAGGTFINHSASSDPIALRFYQLARRALMIGQETRATTPAIPSVTMLDGSQVPAALSAPASAAPPPNIPDSNRRAGFLAKFAEQFAVKLSVEIAFYGLIALLALSGIAMSLRSSQNDRPPVTNPPASPLSRPS